MQVVAAVLDRDRIDPVATVRGEVLERHGAVVGAACERNALRDGTAVEALALGRGDVLERFGLLRAIEALARVRRAILGQEGPAEFREALEGGRLARPAERGDRRDHVALARVTDRGLEERLERQLAVALGERDPGGNAARHGDRVPSDHRHRALAREALGRPALRRASRAVEADEALAVPENGEGVRAYAVRRRFNDGERDRGGQAGIHRIPAAREHRQARLRGERLRSRHHVLRENGHALRRIREVPGEHERKWANGSIGFEALFLPATNKSLQPRA